MDYLSNAQIINKITTSILQPKRSTYSQDPLYVMLESMPQIGYADPAVYNRYKQKLKVSLFYHHGQPRTQCIIFMHGFGSNRLQALNIMPHLPKNLSLCCFDFSAEGKSQGKMVTYGKKQKDDIRAVMGYLRNCKFQSFILWGRSMGASSALYYVLKEHPEDVIVQILDSPYFSFSGVAAELTKKKINLPDFVIQTGLDAMSKNLQNHDFNPFQVNFNKPINCNIPTLFVYSEEDDVVSCRNTHSIIQNFSGHYEKMIIKENHNVIRTPVSVKRVLDIIRKYANRNSAKRKSKSIQKQITFNRHTINRKMNSEDSFDNYGIWVSSKFEQSHRKNYQHGRNNSNKKMRPKSSIKVFSANKSIHCHNVQSSVKNRELQQLSQSFLSKTTSKSLNSYRKNFRHLSNELYL